jgi:hypothetical protein
VSDWDGPTSDPSTWPPVPPNTIMSAAGALQRAASRYRIMSRIIDGADAEADACEEIAERLLRAMRAAWPPRLGAVDDARRTREHMTRWAEGADTHQGEAEEP